MKTIHRKITVILSVLFLTACVGSPVRNAIEEHRRANMPQAEAPAGYELIAEEANGYKWYVAPASKASVQIEGRNPVTGKVEVNTFTSISLFIAWPYAGKTSYQVEAFACGLLPGTYAHQRSDNRGWDERYTTVAYGTHRWKIWNYVCKDNKG